MSSAEGDATSAMFDGMMRGSGKTARDIQFGLFESGYTTTSADVDDVLTATDFGAS